jgi:hypothetical protein
MLGSAQPVRFLTGKGRRYRTVFPCDAPLARLVLRPIPRWRHGQDAGLAFDHNVACIGGCRGDKGDATGATGLDQIIHPSRARGGFSPTAAGQD